AGCSGVAAGAAPVPAVAVQPFSTSRSGSGRCGGSRAGGVPGGIQGHGELSPGRTGVELSGLAAWDCDEQAEGSLGEKGTPSTGGGRLRWSAINRPGGGFR